MDVTHIARCPVHGLHGERTECFVCGGPVERVPMLELDAHGVPSMPSWRAAIDWLAEHGGAEDRDDTTDTTVSAATFAQYAQTLEDLLEEVARQATLGPGGTGHPYHLGREHRVWALWGRWRGGGGDMETARGALIAAIRDDLLAENAR